MNKALNLNKISEDLKIEKRVLYFYRRGIEARSKSSIMYRDAVKQKVNEYIVAKISDLDNITIEEIDRIKWFKKNNVFDMETLRKLKARKLNEQEQQTVIQTFKEFSETLLSEIES